MIIDISKFVISELQLGNLASEFYACSSFPTGDHDEAHLEFHPSDPSEVHGLEQQFLKALQSFRKNY